MVDNIKNIVMDGENIIIYTENNEKIELTKEESTKFLNEIISQQADNKTCKDSISDEDKNLGSKKI